MLEKSELILPEIDDLIFDYNPQLSHRLISKAYDFSRIKNCFRVKELAEKLMHLWIYKPDFLLKDNACTLWVKNQGIKQYLDLHADSPLAHFTALSLRMRLENKSVPYMNFLAVIYESSLQSDTYYHPFLYEKTVFLQWLEVIALMLPKALLSRFYSFPLELVKPSLFTDSFLPSLSKFYKNLLHLFTTEECQQLLGDIIHEKRHSDQDFIKLAFLYRKLNNEDRVIIYNFFLNAENVCSKLFLLGWRIILPDLDACKHYRLLSYYRQKESKADYDMERILQYVLGKITQDNLLLLINEAVNNQLSIKCLGVNFDHYILEYGIPLLDALHLLPLKKRLLLTLTKPSADFLEFLLYYLDFFKFTDIPEIIEILSKQKKAQHNQKYQHLVLQKIALLVDAKEMQEKYKDSIHYITHIHTENYFYFSHVRKNISLIINKNNIHYFPMELLGNNIIYTEEILAHIVKIISSFDQQEKNNYEDTLRKNLSNASNDSLFVTTVLLAILYNNSLEKLWVIAQKNYQSRYVNALTMLIPYFNKHSLVVLFDYLLNPLKNMDIKEEVQYPVFSALEELMFKAYPFQESNGVRCPSLDELSCHLESDVSLVSVRRCLYAIICQFLVALPYNNQFKMDLFKLYRIVLELCKKTFQSLDKDGTIRFETMTGSLLMLLEKLLVELKIYPYEVLDVLSDYNLLVYSAFTRIIKLLLPEVIKKERQKIIEKLIPILTNMKGLFTTVERATNLLSWGEGNNFFHLEPDVLDNIGHYIDGKILLMLSSMRHLYLADNEKINSHMAMYQPKRQELRKGFWSYKDFWQIEHSLTVNVSSVLHEYLKREYFLVNDFIEGCLRVNVKLLLENMVKKNYSREEIYLHLRSLYIKDTCLSAAIDFIFEHMGSVVKKERVHDGDNCLFFHNALIKKILSRQALFHFTITNFNPTVPTEIARSIFKVAYSLLFDLFQAEHVDDKQFIYHYYEIIIGCIYAEHLFAQPSAKIIDAILYLFDLTGHPVNFALGVCCPVLRILLKKTGQGVLRKDADLMKLLAGVPVDFHALIPLEKEIPCREQLLNFGIVVPAQGTKIHGETIKKMSMFNKFLLFYKKAPKGINLPVQETLKLLQPSSDEPIIKNLFAVCKSFLFMMHLNPAYEIYYDNIVIGCLYLAQLFFYKNTLDSARIFNAINCYGENTGVAQQILIMKKKEVKETDFQIYGSQDDSLKWFVLQAGAYYLQNYFPHNELLLQLDCKQKDSHFCLAKYLARRFKELGPWQETQHNAPHYPHC